jgi:anthranilate synthase/aminodeoxychorismate synthase-like glutamine amidotransferase
MILIIDNYDSFTYNLYQGIAQFESDVQVVRNDKITLHEIKQLQPAGIVLSPGPGRPEQAGICIDLIHALDKQTPLLGVCLGHQAIVTAFGGRVVQAAEIMHGKPDKIFHQQNNLYRRMPMPFQAGRYHSLIAERSSLPATLLIEAQNAAGLVMGIRHAQRPIYGVQFHPESILTPEGHLLLQQFAKECLCYAQVSNN